MKGASQKFFYAALPGTPYLKPFERTRETRLRCVKPTQGVAVEQRKWLSWNDVERLAARLEDVQLERSRRTTYLPSELYKLKAPNWLRNQTTD